MNKPLQLLLADDDSDDRNFFAMALKTLSFPTKLTTVNDGKELMDHLNNSKHLPDVLFLDINMPRKNGSECLEEIKQNQKLKNIPVIIYSTSLYNDIADLFYKNGAHYYIRKGNLDELENVLERVFKLMKENKFERPARAQFILSSEEEF